MTELNEPMAFEPGDAVDPSNEGDDAEDFLPSLLTSEFSYPVGDEIPLPEEHESPISDVERIINEADFLPVWFLERGVAVQRAVARVVLTKPHTVRGYTFSPGAGWATGFMVSPSLFLTNNHVIENTAFTDKMRVQFNYQVGPDGMELETESFLPVADGAFHTNPALDYTLVRLLPNEDGAGNSIQAGDRWGFIPLSDTVMFSNKQHFNVVQHPNARHKELALQDNEIDKLFTNTVRYKADTEPGSSGSPVFDNMWQLVALHHAGGDQAADGTWLNNEGIRIDAIIRDLRNHFTDIGRQDVLDELGI